MNSRRREVGCKEGYALWAKSYDGENNPLIAVEEPYVEDILKHISYSHVLDVGTGTGRYALRMARSGACVTALDNCPEILEVAKRSADKESLKIDFHLASLEKPLPYDSNIFDSVICALTLTHIPNIKEVIGEFNRVLNEDGHLLITDFHPDGVAQGWRTEFQADDILYKLPNMNHTRQDYINAVKKTGIELLKVIDVPIREVPTGYLPEYVIHKYAEVNLCMIILARKQRNFLKGQRAG
jgi:ubiquinone/menaquinone biosynthesis C-methylase UbiE